ncbi:CdaR family transcriptional regulator, partial [Lachnotalea glycerini]
MLIPKKQMQKIAEEVGETIHKNVNIMDETGCIIASTDPERIGMFHRGAMELLNHQMEKLIIHRDEKDYQGTRSGINLPLVIEEQVIGVVGITGEVEEVQLLGTVIKKMTEILILDWYKSNQKKALEDMKRSFAIELLFGDDEKRLEFGRELLGINMNLSRIVAVLDFVVKERKGVNDNKSQDLFEKITNMLRKEIEQNQQQLVMTMGMKIVIFYQMQNTNEVYKSINTAKNKIELLYSCKFYCGIGTTGDDKAGIQRSYREAESACNLVKQLTGETIKVYSNSDLRMLLVNIPYKKRLTYINTIFKDCEQEQVENVLQCLRCYINNNGSISKTSDELFIHKNTLQYRLTRIKALTGYDPRT